MAHTEDDPCYLKIAEPLRLIRQPLNKVRWDFLNSIIDSEPPAMSPCDSQATTRSFPPTQIVTFSTNQASSSTPTCKTASFAAPQKPPNCSFELPLEDFNRLLEIDSKPATRIPLPVTEEEMQRQISVSESPDLLVQPDDANTLGVKRQRPDPSPEQQRKKR